MATESPTPPTPQSDFRHTAVQDLLGRPPGWLLYSGITTITIVVFVLLGLSAIIRYPETIAADFMLQTQSLPLEIVPKEIGVIDSLFVDDGAQVQAGDTLLAYRSEVDWRPVRHLTKLIEAFPAGPEAWSAWDSKYQHQLEAALINRYPSEIAAPLNALVYALEQARTHLSTSTLPVEIVAYEQEVIDAERLRVSLQRQLQLFNQELTYQQIQTDRIAMLESDSLVSTQELETTTARTINSQRQLEALRGTDIEYQLRVSKVQQQILTRQLEESRIRQTNQQVIGAALAELRTAIDVFQDRYFEIARESGVVYWRTEVQDRKVISPGTALGHLFLSNSSRQPVARLMVQSNGGGRVSVGEKVILELAAFPAREFGQLEGRVIDIAPTVDQNDRDGTYFRMVEVSLSESLSTTYNKTIPFRYNLSGKARIVTADRTLLQRILGQFLNLSKNS